MTIRKETRSGEPDGYIDPVPYDALIEANRHGKIDAQSAKIREREMEYIRRWRQARSDGDEVAPSHSLSALALSGGGIRSATFALGVTQAFAARDVMRRFDYLSTVSGGGYLGSALTWLTRGVEHVPLPGGDLTFAMHGDRFPFPVDPPRLNSGRKATPAQDAQLIYLRQHGKYLTPGRGIDVVSVIAVGLRGLLLNLLVWLPLTAVAMYLLMIVPWWNGIGIFGEKLAEWPGYEAAAGVAALAGLIFALSSIVYSLLTFKSGNDTTRRYLERRFFETHIRYALWSIAVALPLALLPIASSAAHEWLASLGFVSVISGLAAAVGTFLRVRSTTSNGPKWMLSVIAPIGAILLLYGLLILAYLWAEPASRYGSACWFWWALHLLWPLSILTGVLVNVNLTSMHRYYRDRLSEAFLPDPPTRQNAKTSFSDLATRADVYPLSQFSKGTPTGPYHLLNTNVILVHSDEWNWRSRGGDSFILSPLFCGSNATGWRDTEKFLGGDLTLSTAMAISGAAANPYSGGGLFRNRPVAVLMSLVNVRLGYWVSHPSPRKRFKTVRTHFDTAWRELSGSLDENSRLVQLSDGGHFDNLGIYELIRRRVELIVACDGTADPEFGFSDFITLLARIEADFGARITFNEKNGHGLNVFMPTRPAGFPRDTQLATRGFTVGEIVYSDGSCGQLIYITTTLFAGLGLQTLGYRAANPDFPDQTTADQFFDEAQFEAYRQLGYSVAEAVFNDVECRSIMERTIGPLTAQ